MAQALNIIEPIAAIPPSQRDESLLAAWAIHQAAGGMIMSRGTYFDCESHSEGETDVLDEAEMRICNTPASTLEGVMAKLWIALVHCRGTKPEATEEIMRGDFNAVLEREPNANFDARLIMQALRDLRQIARA